MDGHCVISKPDGDGKVSFISACMDTREQAEAMLISLGGDGYEIVSADIGRAYKEVLTNGRAIG